MKDAPLSGPVGFSLSNPLDDFAPTLRQAARLAPRWHRDGLGALELGFFTGFHDRVDFTGEQAAALGPLMRAIAQSGCEIWSVHLPFGTAYDLSSPCEHTRRFAVDLYSRMMDCAAEGGARIAVAHPSAEPIAAADRSRHLEQCRRSIEELTARSGGGLRLAIECLPRSCLCSTAQETLALLDGTSAGLCMDTNHPHHEPPADFIRRLAPKLITVHISDDDGVDEKHWMPGRGVIDWADVLDALAAVPYTGAFIYELAPPSGLSQAGLDFIFNYRYLADRFAKSHGE